MQQVGHQGRLAAAQGLPQQKLHPPMQHLRLLQGLSVAVGWLVHHLKAAAAVGARLVAAVAPLQMHQAPAAEVVQSQADENVHMDTVSVHE